MPVGIQLKQFLLRFGKLEGAQMFGTESDADHLVGAGIFDMRLFERTHQDGNHVVAGEQADEHADGNCAQAFDQRPAEVLKMLKEGFDRPAFVRFRGVTLYGLFGHDKRPSVPVRALRLVRWQQWKQESSWKEADRRSGRC